MPPKIMKGALKKAEERGDAQPIGAFFAVKKVPGRPKKKQRKGTPKTAFADADRRREPAETAPAAAQAEAAPEAQAEVSAKRQAPAAKKPQRGPEQGED